MQRSYPPWTIIFMVIGFLATVDVNGQTCNSAYIRCRGSLKGLFSNPDSLSLTCSPGNELRECIGMLETTCASESVGDHVMALRMVIEYVCTPLGMSELDGFLSCNSDTTCAISYPQQVYGLCRSTELYLECLQRDCNMQAEKFYRQLASLRLAQCNASSTEQPGDGAVLCVQEYHRCLTLISDVRPEYNQNVCSPNGQLTSCATSLGVMCSIERPTAASSIGLLITFTEYLCSDQARSDAVDYANCQGSAACYQTFMTNVASSQCSNALTLLEECMQQQSCNDRAVRYITMLVSRPPGCNQETVPLPLPVSAVPIMVRGPMHMVSEGPARPRSSSATSSEKSGILQMVLSCALLMKAIGVKP